MTLFHLFIAKQPVFSGNLDFNKKKIDFLYCISYLIFMKYCCCHTKNAHTVNIFKWLLKFGSSCPSGPRLMTRQQVNVQDPHGRPSMVSSPTTVCVTLLGQTMGASRRPWTGGCPLEPRTMVHDTSCMDRPTSANPPPPQHPAAHYVLLRSTLGPIPPAAAMS